jgi:hypothetical protein
LWNTSLRKQTTCAQRQSQPSLAIKPSTANDGAARCAKQVRNRGRGLARDIRAKTVWRPPQRPSLRLSYVVDMSCTSVLGTGLRLLIGTWPSGRCIDCTSSHNSLSSILHQSILTLGFADKNSQRHTAFHNSAIYPYYRYIQTYRSVNPPGQRSYRRTRRQINCEICRPRK